MNNSMLYYFTDPYRFQHIMSTDVTNWSPEELQQARRVANVQNVSSAKSKRTWALVVVWSGAILALLTITTIVGAVGFGLYAYFYGWKRYVLWNTIYQQGLQLQQKFGQSQFNPNQF